jgi:hypothetical protein
MKKGKLTRQENSWWVESKGKLYPLSLTSSYYAGFSLKEGKKVEFQIETEIYTDLGEQRIEWAVIKSPIRRVEVINHTSDKHPIGRVFTYYGNVEVSMQDGGQTLKVFI